LIKLAELFLLKSNARSSSIYSILLLSSFCNSIWAIDSISNYAQIFASELSWLNIKFWINYWAYYTDILVEFILRTRIIVAPILPIFQIFSILYFGFYSSGFFIVGGSVCARKCLISYILLVSFRKPLAKIYANNFIAL